MWVTRRRLRRLGVPPPVAPYTVEAWCETIAAGRKRPIHVRVIRRPAGEPASLGWIRPEHDLVYLDRGASGFAQAHSLLHEVAHLVCSHDGTRIGPAGTFTQDPVREAEAEAVAAAMAEWLAEVVSPKMPVLRRLVVWVDRWRAYRHLRWLLGEMRRTIPANPAPAAGSRMVVRVGGYRACYVTLVRLHDMLRVLRPYLPQVVWDRAAERANRAGCRPDEQRVAGDAAVVAVALRDYTTGQPVVGEVAAVEHVAGDMDAEVLRWARVAVAMRESPYVSAEVARWAARRQ